MFSVFKTVTQCPAAHTSMMKNVCKNSRTVKPFLYQCHLVNSNPSREKKKPIIIAVDNKALPKVSQNWKTKKGINRN